MEQLTIEATKYHVGITFLNSSMRMDRKIKELLYVLEDEINSRIVNGASFYNTPKGLCKMLNDMEFDYTINRIESHILYNYLRVNNNYKRDNNSYAGYAGYWWIPGDWDIRLEFIKHLIKKNEKKWWQFWK